MTNKSFLTTLLFLCFCPVMGAEFVINAVDPAGTGFNDTTPVAPLPDNPGTTLGEQRINVLARAIEIWGAELVSDVPIAIDAQMLDLTCDTNTGSAVLAAAGAIYVTANFPNAPDRDTLHHPALANAIAGSDTNTDLSDITVQVNINIDEDPACAAIFGGWYLGMDHNNGNQRDLLSTLLHELGHGLGFQSFFDNSTGQLFQGRPDVYTANILDLATGKNWLDMAPSERLISMINDPNLVWEGANVNAEAPSLLVPDGLLLLKGNSPAAVQRKFATIAAGFGPAVSTNITAEVVYVDPPDACSPITDDLTGKIALIDRGECDFSAKALEAQNAGALAVIIANNVTGPLVNMGGGSVGNQITIPVVALSLEDGDVLKAAMPVDMTLGRDPEAAGLNDGHVRLHAPNPFEPGSSVSHFTEQATPELLMEPNASDELSDDLDLTISLFKDIGWPTQAAPAAVSRLLYPWLSNRDDEFESIIVANNFSNQPIDVTFRARRSTGNVLTATAQIPALGFFESNVRDLFTDLDSGGGFAVEMEAETELIAGRWVTTSLQAASQASPAQGVAALVTDGSSKRQVGTSLLYGYLPNTGNVASAPVVVNAGTANTAVTLYFYDKDGELLLEDTTTITNLEPYRPFALPVALLLPGTEENVTMVAHSAGQPLTGAAFIFDSDFNEPAIGTAQVITFNP